MADSPLRFLRELLDPYEPLLDRLFLFGTVYGTWNVFKCCYYVLSGFRRYILRIGASPVTVAKLGEWAGMNNDCHVILVLIFLLLLSTLQLSMELLRAWEQLLLWM